MVYIYCSIKRVYIIFTHILTYLFNISIDIAIFRQHFINIVSKSKK